MRIRIMGRMRALGGAGALLVGLVAGACAPAGPGSPVPQPATRTPSDALRSIASTPETADTTQWRGALPARAEELLAARFPGVQVIQLTNGDVSVRIRGETSLIGNNEPLFIIDGQEVLAPPGRALAGINPNDIARIEVLKDAGSTSMYGVHGANGVIIITTKRGR